MALMSRMFRIAGGLVLTWSAGFVLFAALALQPAGETGTADAIVALTGGGARIEEAVKLLAEHRGQRLLISGVNQHTSRNALRQQAPDYADLFDCCIDIGYWAQDTAGNARETEVWSKHRGFKRLIVVTSGYHMARSLAEIAQVFPDATLIPHPVMPASVQAKGWWASPATTRVLMVEYVKLWPALARLGLARLLPGPRQTTEAASSSATANHAAVD
jgi:uncharacterized SAM-binding protein YcdF (DUF218 family)